MAQETGKVPPPSTSWVVDTFTLPGRILLMVFIVAFIGLLVLYFENTIHLFPQGSYPVIMWVLPVFLLDGLGFLLSAWLLEWLGIKIYKPKE